MVTVRLHMHHWKRLESRKKHSHMVIGQCVWGMTFKIIVLLTLSLQMLSSQEYIVMVGIKLRPTCMTRVITY